MKRRNNIGALVALGAAVSIAASGAASVDRTIWTDFVGDVLLRRTDAGGQTPLLPFAIMPDVISVSLLPWQPLDPACDPYIGLPTGSTDAHLVRLDVLLNGLVCPPGPLGLNGAEFAPDRFGHSPLYGFFEIDLDNDRNTGGELASAAKHRTLAVGSRYSARPSDPLLLDRAPTCTADFDTDWQSPPFFERTGTDFALSFCGCYDSVVVSETGNMDGRMDPGETLIVRGRFFQRAGGYRAASNMQGGSGPGAYDPWVNVRFQHEPVSNLTLVSLVYPLTMAGAASLAGEPVQPIDSFIDEQGSHSSIEEALADLVAAAHGQLWGLAGELTSRWIKKEPQDFLNPLLWGVSFAVGTTYAEQGNGFYAWTDIGFTMLRGDVDGDGAVTPADQAAVQSALNTLDGSPTDQDGVVDGVVVLGTPGQDFSLFDLNGDTLLSASDVTWFSFSAPCNPDWNRDGVVDVPDIFDFLTDWFNDNGDFNNDGVSAVDDIFLFLTSWFQGCI